MKFYFLVIAFTLSASTVQAQKKEDTLSYSSWKKYSDKVQSGTNKYLQYFTDSLGQVLRINTFKTRTVKQDPANANILWVIQRYNKAKGNEIETDTAFINKVDFSPLAYHTDIQSAGYKEVVQFTQDSIYTSVFYKDSTKHVSYPSSPDYFIATTMEDMMGMLPLKIGYTVVVKNVNPGVRHNTTDYKVSVVRKEKIQLSDHSTREAYLVEAGFPAFKSYSQYWFSVDKQLMLKHSFKMRDGSFFIEERLMP